MPDKSSPNGIPVADIWTQQEKAQLRPYLNGALMRIQTGIATGNKDMIESGSKLLQTIVQIKMLLDLFDAHKGNVKAMGLEGTSRNGLYFKIEYLGLKPDHFRDRSATVETLLRDSKWGELAREVAGAMNAQWQSRARG